MMRRVTFEYAKFKKGRGRDELEWLNELGAAGWDLIDRPIQEMIFSGGGANIYQPAEAFMKRRSL